MPVWPMGKKHEARITVTESSGNVFADLGLPEPEEALARAQLASHIWRAIARQRLSQAAAAARMGIDQPEVSALMNGRIDKFSSRRLKRLLTLLIEQRHPSRRQVPTNLRKLK